MTEIQFEAIRIGTYPWTLTKDPSGFTVVGWPTWLWADDPDETTWGPISRSTTENGYTISLTGVVTEVTWDMGNGDVITCGKGTPFTKKQQGPNDVSPDCDYRYPHDGTYTITATSHWAITWTGVGQHGVIEHDLSRTADIHVTELHTVNIPNPNQ